MTEAQQCPQNSPTTIKDEVLSREVETWETSVRTYNLLKRNDLKTIGDVAKLTRTEFEGLKGIGRKTINEVLQLLANDGLSLRDDAASATPIIAADPSVELSASLKNNGQLLSDARNLPILQSLRIDQWQPLEDMGIEFVAQFLALEDEDFKDYWSKPSAEKLLKEALRLYRIDIGDTRSWRQQLAIENLTPLAKKWYNYSDEERQKITKLRDTRSKRAQAAIAQIFQITDGKGASPSAKTSSAQSAYDAPLVQIPVSAVLNGNQRNALSLEFIQKAVNENPEVIALKKEFQGKTKVAAQKAIARELGFEIP